MKPQTAVVLGATGLIGSEVVTLLLADDNFVVVRVLVRRPYTVKHPKLDVQEVDFDNTNDFKDKLGVGDAIFCCIGTTNSKMKGDKNAYRKVDYDIAVNAARLGLEANYTQFLLVSAVGANASSKNFYTKLKGEVEDAVARVPFKSIHMFQPSILFGNRKEFRLGEMIAKGLMKALSFLFIGSLNKYKGIDANDVARAMVAASKKQKPGVSKYQHKQMMTLVDE